MKKTDDNILATLRGYFLLAAANTSRTVFELFGAAAAEALREEAVKKWPKIGGIA